MKDLEKLKDESREALEQARLTRESRPAEPSSNTVQVIGLVATFCIALNVGFYFLSDLYFADKSKFMGADPLNGVRIAFAVFSGTISIGAILTAIAPKYVSHGLAAVAGLVALVASFYSFKRGMPAVLPVSLFIIGALLPMLVWRSLEYSRGAWAFLISMCGVLALVFFFGAPKVRGVLGIGLWTALIMPGLLTVATVGLTMLRVDYRERG